MLRKFTCEYCDENFKTSEKLTKHLSSNTRCEKYKGISFSCDECGDYITKSPLFIKKHKKSGCENKMGNYIDKHKNLLFDNEFKKQTVIFEEFKNEYINQSEFYRKRIAELENALNQKEKSNDSVILKDDDKKKVYRAPNPKYCDVVPPKNRETEIEEISKIYDNRRKTCRTFEESEIIFKDYFEELFNMNKLDTQHSILENIRKTRLELLKVITYEKYKKLLEEHLSKIQKYLKSKNFSDKRSNKFIQKGLNAIDTRILFSLNYTNSFLESDEINFFESSLEFSGNFNKEYSPFFFDSFLKKFHNYGAVVLSLKKLMTTYLFNNFGFHNYIYLRHKKSLDTDPYTFYRLVKIEKGFLNWEMDCRAEDLTNNFISDILPYLTSLFRKIYFDIFHDNIYRKDYSKENLITENELGQLIQNIFLLSNQRNCCDIFRETIREKASKDCEEGDKFSMYSDDFMQRDRFASYKYNTDSILEAIHTLFDNINKEDAVDLLREKYIPVSIFFL